MPAVPRLSEIPSLEEMNDILGFPQFSELVTIPRSNLLDFATKYLDGSEGLLRLFTEIIPIYCKTIQLSYEIKYLWSSDSYSIRMKQKREYHSVKDPELKIAILLSIQESWNIWYKRGYITSKVDQLNVLERAREI